MFYTVTAGVSDSRQTNQSAPRGPRDDKRLRVSPRSAPPLVSHGSGSGEAQLGERGNGVRVGGRVGQHTRLEQLLVPGAGCGVRGAGCGVRGAGCGVWGGVEG